MNGSPPARPDYSILSAFEGPIVRPRASFLYLCGLVLVSVTMVLLVLSYFVLIALVSWSVYYHAAHNGTWGNAAGHSPRLALLMVVVYLTPLIMGLVVVFFILKPIFAGR